MNSQQSQFQPQAKPVYADADPYAGSDSSTYDKEKAEFLTLQIDVSDLLDDFEHRVLRGEVKKVNPVTGEEFWDQMAKQAEPIINEVGIREIMARLIGRVTKAAKLSYKEDKEIYNDMFYFDMSITELIAKRSDVWELDIETAKSIKDSCVELVWDIVASSRSGFTAINLRSQYSRQDVTRNESQNSGGSQRTIFGIPLGRKN